MLNENFEAVSLCKVVESYSDFILLQRLADVKDGRFIHVNFNEDEPDRFDNRSHFKCKSGPMAIGTIGIWKWSASPIYSDPSKDHIEVTYQTTDTIVEFYSFPDVSSMDQLLNKIKLGVKLKIICENIFFCYFHERNLYMGVLCHGKDIVRNGAITLGKGIEFLDQYLIDSKNVFSISNQEITLINGFNLGNPCNRVLLKDPLEIVKSAILARGSWSVAKRYDITRSEWKRLKEFIQLISMKDLYQEIAGKCLCSEKKAEELVADFTLKADQCMSGTDIESEVLMAVIEDNEKLRKACENSLEEKWLKDNEKRISEADIKLRAAEERLNGVEKNIEDKNNQLSEVSTDIANKQKLLEDKDKEYEEKIAMGDDVIALVKEKIKSAQNDASSFISEMLFKSPIGLSQSTTSVMEKYASTFIYEGKLLEEPEEYANYKELFNILTSELQEAGIAREFLSDLSAFLISMYYVRMPLLIAGPNAQDIANALSISLCAKYPAILTCGTEYDENTLTLASKSDASVIVIKDMFQANWINKVIDFLNSKDKYCIVVQPFSEDLFIEPKSLYNYAFPLLTEPLVEKKAGCNYSGGRRKGELAKLEYVNPKHGVDRLLRSLGAGRYLSEMALNVSGYADCVYDARNVDMEYLEILYSYATVTGKIDSFKKNLVAEKKLSQDTKILLLSLVGDDD